MTREIAGIRAAFLPGVVELGRTDLVSPAGQIIRDLHPVLGYRFTVET